MIAQLPPEIASLLTTKTLVWATAGWVLAQNLGRVYQAIRLGGGLRGIWQGLMYGTNAKTDTQATTPSEPPKPNP